MKNEEAKKYIQTYYMKTNVYYHIWAPTNTDMWKIMVDEQIKRLYRSGLPEIANVKCAINGLQILFLYMIGLISLMCRIVIMNMKV